MNFVRLKGLLLQALPHNNSLQHGRLRSLQMVVNQTFQGLRNNNSSNGKTVLAFLRFVRPKRPRKVTLMVTIVSSVGLAGYGLRAASSGLLTPEETFHR